MCEIDWYKTIELLVLVVPIYFFICFICYNMGRQQGYRAYVKRYRHMKPTGINRPIAVGREPDRPRITVGPTYSNRIRRPGPHR